MPKFLAKFLAVGWGIFGTVLIFYPNIIEPVEINFVLGMVLCGFAITWLVEQEGGYP